ncbi:MAG TPA: alanine racemase [Candidatus Saccharimonadales bacterium]|nr:alanine racemase [Candidatus Saccharimonadales bacterium]
MRFPTWVEIDLDVFEQNLARIQQAVDPARVLLVVKADAYGHGAARLALAAEPRVAMFGVATLHEGIELRAAGVTRPILILSPTLPVEAEEILDYGLLSSVDTLEFAQRLSEAAARRGSPAGFHIEVDTGMGRTGVSEAGAPEFVARVAALPGLRLDGLYTHFPESDAPDLGGSREQLRRFLQLVERLRAAGVAVPRVHAANSGAAVRLPEARLDLVRTGILAYGLMPRTELEPFPGIRPVMSMKSRLVQVREFPAGATVSYGRTFTCKRPSRIGVVPAGYGHGLSWLLSNHGTLLVRGRRVPIVGTVTMDLTMVDLTDVPGAQVYDEVVIFGSQGGETLGAAELAAGSRTLVYEVLCTLGKRVVRVYRRGAEEDQVTTLVGERSVVTPPGGEGVRVEYSRVPRGGGVRFR